MRHTHLTSQTVAIIPHEQLSPSPSKALLLVHGKVEQIGSKQISKLKFKELALAIPMFCHQGIFGQRKHRGHHKQGRMGIIRSTSLLLCSRVDMVSTCTTDIFRSSSGLLSHAIPASTPLRNCGAWIIKHLFSRTNLFITVVRESSEAQEDD